MELKYCNGYLVQLEDDDMNEDQPYQTKSFESTGISSDTSANIYMSMLTSKAWYELSKPQQVLYLYCKAQYYGEKKKPTENIESFTMNKHKWGHSTDKDGKLVGYCLYADSNGKGFIEDMQALIIHGFVKCIKCGSETRTKNIYAFSSMWQKYGADEFFIPISDMTSAMVKKIINGNSL